MLHCLGETTEDGHIKEKILVFHLLSAWVPGFVPSELPGGVLDLLSVIINCKLSDNATCRHL